MQKNILLQNDSYEKFDIFSDISFDIFKEFSGMIFSMHLIFQILQIVIFKIICKDLSET